MIVVFSLASEFNHFKYIEISAKKHEPVDCKIIESLGHLIKCVCSLVLVLYGKTRIVLEDDFELTFIHVHHFKRFLHHRFLLLKRKLSKYFFSS